MAVSPIVQTYGLYSIVTWVLTSADDVALPSPAMGHRNDKTIDVFEVASGGWGTATIQIQGDLNQDGDGNFKLLNSVPDTTEFTFVSTDAVRQLPVLPNVTRVKPVRTAGALGADGVKIIMLATSGRDVYL